MKGVLFAVLVGSCAVSKAEVYKCPQVYPGKDAKRPHLPLTNAFMQQGEIRGDGWIMGRDEVAKEGIDTSYGFADDEQAWLVCSYGGTERVKGRFHDGHEWGQYMNGREQEWWLKLAPKAGVCNLDVRELKSRGPGKSMWTATAICERPKP